MTQADLFTTPDPSQEAYALSLRQQWQSDLYTIMEQGRIPAWIELDAILQKDEHRLMDLIEEHGGYVMSDPVLVEYGKDASGLIPVSVTRRVDSLTADCGFVSPGNCRATVNRCIEQGWITEGVDVSGAFRYDMTRLGRYAKNLFEYEMSWDLEE